MIYLGQRVEDPRPNMDALGGMSKITQHRVVGREVRVLVQEVVFAHPHVLKTSPIGGLHQLELVHKGMMLSIGVRVPAELRRVTHDKDTELHVRTRFGLKNHPVPLPPHRREPVQASQVPPFAPLPVPQKKLSYPTASPRSAVTRRYPCEPLAPAQRTGLPLPYSVLAPIAPCDTTADLVTFAM